MSRDVVTKFVSAYVREFDYYEHASRLCMQRLESLLAEQGIRAIVTGRAKKPDKLLRKLIQRDTEKKYKSIEDIRVDIPDLAGVRVALYFPADSARVRNIIEGNFADIERKVFPDPKKVRVSKKAGKRFDGYHAEHYRLGLSEPSLDDGEKLYLSARIEVQVGSVLMHAWAEVEHDLIYKPESGELSKDETAILDELNGLVIAGEIALERLQRALEYRVSGAAGASFDSHYELAAYLERWRKVNDPNGDAILGRVDVLWDLLRRGKVNRDELVSVLDQDIVGFDGPIAQRLIDRLLIKREDLYGIYSELRDGMGLPGIYGFEVIDQTDRYSSIGRFLSKWIVLEKTLRLLGMKNVVSAIGNKITSDVIRTSKQIGLSDEATYNLARIRRIRNELVHGSEVPDSKYLDEISRQLDGVLEELRLNESEQVRLAFQEAS